MMLDVSEKGALLLQNEHGEIQHCLSGEVSLKEHVSPTET